LKSYVSRDPAVRIARQFSPVRFSWPPSAAVPSGVGQSRQEAEDAEIHALPSGLKQIQQIRVEREAEAMRTAHVPRILAGL
jgi:hypothetical protein